MEIFVDAGLFEFLLVIAFATFLNFIFFRKFLLVIYSLMVIAAPICLFFIHKGVLFNVALIFTLFNCIILLILLWQSKYERPNQKIIKINALKDKISKVFKYRKSER